jgi:peptidoglycan/LPS O-acetylase OafA/YrhL
VLFLAVSVRRRWLEAGWAAPLTAPGQLSYGGYLLHATALFLLWDVLAGKSALAAFAVHAATTLTLAALVYRFFELPANRTVRRRLAAL